MFAGLDIAKVGHIAADLVDHVSANFQEELRASLDKRSRNSKRHSKSSFSESPRTKGHASSTKSVGNSSTRSGESAVPLTDSRGRCQGCGNRCYPVKPNCKKRQRAMARLGYGE
ncbi:MAG: hypothetical protein SOY76_06210 [Veillonella caviae]|nr:hypothetical protein [Veillonella caviae]